MSEHVVDDRDEEYDDYVPGGRRRKSRGGKGCLAVLVAFAVLAGGFYLGLDKGVEFVKGQFDSVEDYPGPGTGKVQFEVGEGEIINEIARNLKAKGVTKSVDAFREAALAEPDSDKIQPGVYELAKEMKAADALEVLLDPANQVKTTVTVPEGLRVTDIVSLLGEKTDFPAAQWEKALEKDIGLPDYAEGNPEGYLFPATYEITPGMKPVDVLKAMVERWRQAADEAGLEERAAELGHTPAELMIIASLVEAEGRGDDMPKIARVIYNRLDGPGDKGGTYGYLEIDATVAYGLGLSPGSTELTPEQLAQETPYNTRENVIGLPPTPIEAPGQEAIEAAANPAEGPWYFYVTVNLETGETRFSETYDEFLANREVYKQYCETSDRC
jgi:UPF0755 protein